MNFAGNKFAYISKNKIDNVKTINTNTTGELKDEKGLKSEKKLTLKRELSVERIRDKELDVVYSDDDDLLDSIKVEKSDMKEEIDDLFMQDSNINNNNNLNSLTNDNKEKFKQKKIISAINIIGGRGGKGGSHTSTSSNSMSRQSQVKPKPQLRLPQTYDISSKIQAENLEYEQEVDSNVLTIQFEFLKDKVGYATGDPYICKGCEAFLNQYSVLSPVENSDKFNWECEFCSFTNEIAIETEEIPKTECIDYFLQGKSMTDKNFVNSSYTDDQKVIFTFDTSGSMCVSEPVTGKHKFKGNTQFENNVKELKKFGDNSDQHFGNNSKNVTYISRLQCLQAAIENNLENMKTLTPNVKVGLVQFNNEVIAIGDGTKPPEKVNGNNLNDLEVIKKTAEKCSDMITKSIQDSSDILLKHLYSIEEGGQTALGPAILFSINLIQGSAKGSKIIICTDGLANIGLGCLDNITNPEDHQKIKEFYYDLGQVAKEKGIIVSLITFEGEESQISILSSLMEQTGGSVARVKPTQILEEFSNLLTTEVIATDVKLRIKLHKIMSFRNEKQSDLTLNESTLKRNIGNATNETEVYIEYHFKSSEEISKFKEIDLEKLKSVPFQSIIEYTTKKGEKCIRVMTKKLEISSDKQEIEKQANYNIMSVNAIQKSSQLAKEGDYRGAQVKANAWKKVLKRGTENNNEEANEGYKMFKNNFNDLNNNLLELQDHEIKKTGKTETTTTRTYKMQDRISSNISQTSNVNYSKAKKK